MSIKPRDSIVVIKNDVLLLSANLFDALNLHFEVILMLSINFSVWLVFTRYSGYRLKTQINAFLIFPIIYPSP